MNRTDKKWRKRQAKYDREIDETIAKTIIIENIDEEDREGYTNHVKSRLSLMTAKKIHIKSRMERELAQRCGQELAERFVEKIDFEHHSEDELEKVFIQLVMQKALCRDSKTAESQWDEFARPYRDEETMQKLEIQERECRIEELNHQREEEIRLKKIAEQRIKELEAQLGYSNNQTAQLTPKKRFNEIGLFAQANDRPNSPEEKIMRIDQEALQVI